MSWLDTLDDIRTRDFSKVSMKERDQTARDVVNMSSYMTALVAISPLPWTDVVLMLPIQTGMVVTVGHIYGRKVSKASARELILEMGTTAGVGLLARQGIKALIPMVGPLLTVGPAYAANWAMGRVAMEYFKNPGLNREGLREVFRRAREEGRSLFSKEGFDRFRAREKEEAKAPAPKKKKKAAAKKSGPKKKTATQKTSKK
ncbi:YcjF family protein [Hyalangium sp.]|uniref:YcjF family protein n=1 Tax=Hyalangium sp. TaxID=2028555 RepID=UPI002D532D28|nr:DUF697 domain-containing protein [Hyalangium sp.]HYH95965.1 DUF697 domain-containing protein [Hyalangium sp.]